MKKIVISLFLFFTLSLSLFATSLVGEWTLFPSFSESKKIIDTSKEVYFVADQFLYSYNTKDQSITELNKEHGMSENSVSVVKYNYNRNFLVVCYTNSNIDIIRDGKVYNIPDLKNKSLAASKNINDIFFLDDVIYFAADFGVMLVNYKSCEVQETYFLDYPTVSVAIFDGAIYAATTHGLYSALLTQNLLDKRQWIRITPNQYLSLLTSDNYLLLYTPKKEVYTLDKQKEFGLKKTAINGIKAYSKHYIFFSDTHVFYLNTNLTITKSIPLDKTVKYNDISASNLDGEFWMAANKGIFKVLENGDSQAKYSEPLRLNAPAANMPAYLTFANNRLYVNTSGPQDFPQFTPAYISILENGNWTNITPDDVPTLEKTYQPWSDLYQLAVSPTDKNTFFIGTYIEGLYKFTNNKFVQSYNKSNSPLNAGWAYRISGLTFDKKNNLWMLNKSVSDPTIRILTPDSTWHSLQYSNLQNHELLEKLLILKNSSSTTKFAIVVSKIQYPTTSFIFAFDEQGTFNNSNDDKKRVITPFVDQENKIIESSAYTCIVEDLNGQIWIGSDKGPIIINSPSQVFNSNYQATRIKIPRNDGTNYADFLLQNERINAIAIDGANRKWIATDNSGVYLISENGLQTIHHFTIENSVLLSDRVLSLAIDNTSGMVYIGTDKGLVGYRSDATQGSNDFSNVYAFPNPVRPDYTGWITVNGLQENSLVKITDVAGNLLFQGISTGGQCTWNGCNNSGDRVKSGVYLVYASSSEGTSGVATKILVVN